MDFGINKNFENRIRNLSKDKLEKLYTYITNYFENCEKYGLELRDGQYNMALSVYDSIETNEHLVIEAGVGIGKSYAYLVPLMYYYYITGKSFIISTSTIALEDQLEKDIIKLSKQLNIPLDIVVAKGMTNFMCLNKLGRLAKIKSKQELFKKLDKEKQDRKYYPDIKDSDWDNVCVDNCKYQKCYNKDDCEFYNKRKDMKNANGAIICNHDMLINDLTRSSYGNSLLKKVNYIVCDEAHNLENKIRSSRTCELYIKSTKETIRKSISLLEKYKYYEYDYNAAVALVKKLEDKINDNVNNVIENLTKKGIELEDCNGIDFVFDEEVVNLSQKLNKLLIDISNSIMIFADYNADVLQEELEEKIYMFNVLSKGLNGDNIFWIEHKNKKNYIYYAPKDIAKIGYNLFFYRDDFYVHYQKNKIKTFIFTSATLSIGKNDYSYFMDNIGASKLNSGIAVEYSYASPYDYDNNSLLYCSNDITNPVENKEKYLNELVIKIKELIKITNGKTLVLFTSKSDMNYVYEQIGNNLDGINIYIQNDGSNQDIVKNKFKNEINSVLFSTGIFWEGIDIKGESLSNVIIARLPFPVVNPIMKYKESLFDDGFNNVYIPEMLIKLKQGVGRLIRSEDDKGIVCILDSRINKKYQDIVKESIPIKNFTTDIEDVKKMVKKYNIDK